MALFINLLCLLAILYVTIIERRWSKRALFGCLYVVIIALILINNLFRDFQVNYLFTGAECRIMNTHIESSNFLNLTTYHPNLQVQYALQGQITTQDAKLTILDEAWLSSASLKSVLDAYYFGETYPCWFDASNPSTVVLEQGWFSYINDWKIVGISIVVFMLIIF